MEDSPESVACLIDGFADPSTCQRNKDRLIRMRLVGLPQLRNALSSSQDETIRETCAEVIGAIGELTDIPLLIESLRDLSPHVRFDALLSIHSLAGLPIAHLNDVLEIEPYSTPPATLYRRVAQWWRAQGSLASYRPPF